MSVRQNRTLVGTFPPDDLRERQRAVADAAKYTERYNLSRLRWLLEFLQLPPDDFKRHRRRARQLSEKLAVFCNRYALSAFKPLGMKQIGPLAAEVREAFRAHLAGAPWGVQSGPGLRRRVEFDERRRALVVTYEGDDLAGEFRWAAQDLLTAERTRIGECEGPHCSRLFIKTKGQRYCSKECSQRRRSADFYREHRNKISEARSQAYYEKKAERAAKAAKLRKTRKSRAASKGR